MKFPILDKGVSRGQKIIYAIQLASKVFWGVNKKDNYYPKIMLCFPSLFYYFYFFYLWLQPPITITKRHHILWMCSTLCCHLIILFTFCFIICSMKYLQVMIMRSLRRSVICYAKLSESFRTIFRLVLLTLTMILPMKLALHTVLRSMKLIFL